MVFLLSRDFDISYGLLLYLLPFAISLLTYATTYLAASSTVRSRQEDVKAPPAPTFLPGIGHALFFFLDTPKLASSIRNLFPAYTPFRLNLLNNDVNIVSGAANISAVWRSKLLDSKPAVCMVMKQFFAMPSQALKMYHADDSGINFRPHPNSNIPQEHRLYFHTHRATHSFLSGSTLTRFAARFETLLVKQVAAEQIGHDWIDMPDLFPFLQKVIATAAIDAMCGPTLTSLSPTWIQDFWDFDRSLPYFLKGYPRWFAPKAWIARDRCIHGLKKWHAYAKQHFTDSIIEEDGHDPLFGTELIRNRQNYFAKMPFITPEALASEDLGLIWAENANSVPSIFWFVLELLHDHTLLAKAQAEASACRLDDTAALHFDVSKLCNQPFLQSIHAEVLRLRTSLFLVRGADHGDFHIGKYKFEKGKPIALDTGFAHTDPAVWNEGANKAHPATEFWAERFLIYPSDPGSGPLKPPTLSTTTPSQAQDGSPYFSQAGLDGSWIPFGGGRRQCPGKQFAKQEIILSFAILASVLDIELLDTSERGKPRSDTRYYGLGGMPPDRKVPFRVRMKQPVTARSGGNTNGRTAQ